MTETPRADPAQAGRLSAAFWRLWSAVAVNNTADGITLLAVAWIAATLTDDALSIAVVTAASRLPWVVLVLPFGVVIDRVDRAAAMAYASLVRAAALLCAAVFALSDATSLPSLVALALVLGAAEVVFNTSAESTVPTLVQTNALHRANGHVRGAEIVASDFLGRPVGGLLMRAGAAAAFLATAVGSVVAAWLVWRLRGSRPARLAEPSGLAFSRFWRDLKGGVVFVWSSPILRVLMVTAALANGLMSALVATQVLFVQHLLGLDALGYGGLLAVASVGAVVGSQASAPVARALTPRRALPLAILAMGLCTILVGSLPRSLAAVTVAYVLASAMVTLFSVASLTLRQRATDPEALGRVNATFRFASFGCGLLGMLGGGAFVSGLAAVTTLESALALQYLATGLVLCPASLPLLRILGRSR